MARRAVSLVYEALLLVAINWFAALLFVLIERQVALTHMRFVYQVYLLLMAGAYFVFQWVRGQTLPMKTWRMRLVTPNGNTITVRQAIARYVFATAGVLLLGFGFLWALVDREHQFLHDRLAGTRLARS